MKDRDVPLHSHSGEKQDGRRVGQTLHEVVDLAHRLEVEPGIDGSFLAYSLTFEPISITVLNRLVALKLLWESKRKGRC